jgi:hypothetical protein
MLDVFCVNGVGCINNSPTELVIGSCKRRLLMQIMSPFLVLSLCVMYNKLDDCKLKLKILWCSA